MAWQNWWTFEENATEFSTQCSSTNYSKALFGLLLEKEKDYFVPVSIMSVTGLLQNLLAIQTLMITSFQGKWGTIYKLAYSVNGLLISICLMISVFWSHKFFLIFGLTCLDLNSTGLWISSILAFERMLIEIFFLKLYGMTNQHAFIISVFIFLFVSASYI